MLGGREGGDPMKRFWDYYISPGDLSDAGSAFMSKTGRLIGLERPSGVKWHANSESNRRILREHGRDV